MNCKLCDKKIDVEQPSEIPAKWFGKYVQGQLLEVVCDVCVKNDQWK